MAYEAQGREIARELQDRHGRLLEARLGAPIVLVFERGEWSVPSNFIFKFGCSGSGPECFHAFLHASGFTVSKQQIEDATSGEVFTAPERRVASSPALVPTAAGAARPGKKRLLVGLALILILMPLTMANAALDRRAASRDRMNMMIGSILLFCWGSGLIAAAWVVRSRHSRVMRLAAGAGVEAAEIAQQTGVSEALIRRWTGESPPLSEIRDAASRVRVRELQAKAAALEQAIFWSTTRRMRVQALEAGARRRLLGTRRILALTAIVLTSPLLFLVALLVLLLLTFPGVLYAAFFAFSDWDEFEANPQTTDRSAGGAMLTLAGLALFPIVGGFALFAAIAGRFGFLRPLVIARTEREFILGAVAPASLLRTRFDSVELFPIESASLELAESKRRTTVLCFTAGAMKRYIAVRTPKGFLSGSAESVENRALLMQAVVRERPAAAAEAIVRLAPPLSPPVSTAAIQEPVIQVAAPQQPALDEAMEPWEDARTLHARSAPPEVPTPAARPAESLRPGLSAATAIGGVLALAVFSSVVVWLTLRAPAGSAPSGTVASAPAAATPPAAAPAAVSVVPPVAPPPVAEAFVPPAAVPPAPAPIASLVAAPPRPEAARPVSRVATPTPQRSRATGSRPVANALATPAPTESAVAPPAEAAPAAPAVDTVAVRNALEAGARSETGADWEAALNHYQTARKLDPSLGVIVDSAIERVKARMGPAARDAFNRARQYDALGRAVEAIAWYERAIRGLPDTDPNRDTAVERLAILRRGAR